jgi:hypothetical protein
MYTYDENPTPRLMFTKMNFTLNQELSVVSKPLNNIPHRKHGQVEPNRPLGCAHH